MQTATDDGSKGPFRQRKECDAAAPPYSSAFYVQKCSLFVPAEADEMAKTQAKLTAKTSVVCEMLGLSQQRHQQLYADGKMPPPIDGKVDVAESVKAYISILKREDPAKQARAATEAAKLRDMEIRTAVRLGKLMDADDVEAYVAHSMAIFRNELENLPRALTRDVSDWPAMERAIDALIARYHQRFVDAQKLLKQGKNPMGDDGDSDDDD